MKDLSLSSATPAAESARPPQQLTEHLDYVQDIIHMMKSLGSTLSPETIEQMYRVARGEITTEDAIEQVKEKVQHGSF